MPDTKAFSWSYSKLSLYEKCPAQYKYRYVQGLATPKSMAASRGSEIHASVENFLLGKAKTVHEAAADYMGLFKELKSHKPLIEEKIAISDSWDVVPWAAGWGRMVIDSYYVEKKAVVMQEWKSGKMYDDHEDQRNLYGTVTMLKHPETKTATVRTIYLDLGKAVKVEYTRDHVEDIIEDFDRRINFLKVDDEMSPRPGWYCRFCPFSRMSSSGGPCKIG